MWLSRSFCLLALVPFVCSLAPTDEIQDADPAQSGYLDNHNMHPATVGSAIFGILWKNAYNSKERWYAKPLVYTPPGQKQLVFVASAMNIIRTLDAVDGTLLKERTVQPPFLQSELGCTDIPDFIGIIGTPIIDPATNTAYFFSKGYKNGAASGGVAKGIYKFYAVNILTLEDIPGFPVLIDGNFADNDPTRYFIGGTVLQRPSLTMINGVVLGGFGGHCDLFNYTGMLVAVSTTPGKGVVSMFAMESEPGASPVQEDIFVEKGGKAGIWHGGAGLATDGNRLFLATGNGQGHANGDVAASGRTPLSTLDEVVASLTISPEGKISLTDYFEPYEYISMDAGDRDLGSGGITLLDPNVFKGTGVSRIAVSVGKNAKVYIMNANNLGGFKQGAGGVDNIVQTISADGAVFGGTGSYPLEGGYIYFTSGGFPTRCYKMGADAQGKPLFTLVGSSAANGDGRVGIGIPTITTYKGQPGTGILWITGPVLGLRAFNAVPKDGVLTPIALPPTGGLNKFLRPAFGDGRLYISDSKGNIICLGSPVALPLNCTQPVDFGEVAIGSAATQTVTCTALIPITSVNGCSTGDATWQCSNSTMPKGPVAKGDSFSFPVIWNLTQASINDAQNASFGKVLPGAQSASLDIFTTNSVAKYSTVLPISLSGVTVSQNAFFTISPPAVDLGGIVVGSDAATSGLSAAVILSNVGVKTLTILGSAWTDFIDAEGESDEPVVFHNITDGDLGGGFSSSSLPVAGDTLITGQSITLPLKFVADETGSYATFLQFWTTGGTLYVLLTASASTAPIASISVSNGEGFYNSIEPVVMDFGDVLSGTTVSRNIRICNSGGAALEITKSKPPIQIELLAPNSATDLHEGQTIDVGECALGEVSIVAAPIGVNKPSHTVNDMWILNTDDLTFGVHDVAITANIVSKQAGPLLADGISRYAYLGCYYDGAGRLFPKRSNSATNENGQCQTTCYNLGYKFAGTEYHTECWCGNVPPTALKFSENSLKKCAWSCPGDVSQACGGDGTYVSVYYDRERYTPGADSIPVASSSSSVVSSTISSSSLSTVSSLISTSSLSLSVSSSPTSFVVSTISSSTSASSTISSSIFDSSTASSTSSISSEITTPLTSVGTQSTSSSAMPTQTGPAIVQKVGSYSYVGCYAEPTTGKALTGKSYKNDNMSVEICAATCAGFTWFGVEYKRECYCGNSLMGGSAPSTLTTKTCSLLCMGNSLEYCGGSSLLSMYNNIGAVLSSSSSVPSTSSSSSSVPSSASSSSSSTSVLSTVSSVSSSSSELTTSLVSSTSTSSTISEEGSATGTSSSDLSTSTTSTSGTTSVISTSETSISTTSTSGTTSVTSTSETSISTTSASGTSSVTSTSETSISTTSSPAITTLVTSTSSTIVTSSTISAILGFASLGCFSDPATGPYGGHNMPKLFSNDSMTPQLCISSALARLSAVPATTYRYIGVEYGRECYAGSVAPNPEPSTLVGTKACTMPCAGNASIKCGGGKMYNLYAATTATITGTGTTVWQSAPATITA